MTNTQEQQAAIDTKGCNLLISAGAGSGKTTVLSERVIRILEDGVDIDRLIILTFTNAAAAEMRHRIKAKIMDRPHLASQLIKLENATISTFDSFCLNLVRQYHYVLGLPSDIGIADDILLHDLYEKELTNVFERHYQNQDKAFVDALTRLYDKNDRLLKEGVRTLLNGIQMIPNRLAYLHNLESWMYSKEHITQSLEDFSEYLRQEVISVSKSIQQFLQSGIHEIHPKLKEFYQSVESIYGFLLEDYSFDATFSQWVNLDSNPTLPRKSKDLDEESIAPIKAIFEPIKKHISDVKKQLQSLFSSNQTDLVRAIDETRPTVSLIIKLTSEWLEAISKRQKELNLYDFTDMMQYAITLLETNPSIRNSLKDTTYEIMIDEYQDTNDLQDYLIGLFENNNTFMVGDAKQSIYGFRNANPKNFVKKFHRYQANDGGKTIVLRDNFRSRSTVIDAVNTLFSPLMDEAMGGLDYINQQALVFANHQYDLEGSMDASVETIHYHEPEAEELAAVDEEVSIIIQRIKTLIENKTPVLVMGKTPHYRPIDYKDICILIDRKSDFDRYANGFNEADIPLDVIQDEPMKASSEVLFLYQSLRLMDCIVNPDTAQSHLKSAFFGVARSFVYQIDDEIIIEAILDGFLNSIDGFKSLHSNPTFSKLIEDTCTLAEASKVLPVDAFIQRWVEQIQLYSVIDCLDNPSQVEQKLDGLFNRIQALSPFSFANLAHYFEQVYENQDLDLVYSEPLQLSKNKVKLMTIHKSKGLEFPVCFYPGLDKRFNVQEWNQAIIFHPDYGLVIKAEDNGFYDTLWKMLIKQKAKLSEQSERIRLFYVAMTRAKEKLIFLINEDRSNPTSMFDEHGKVALEERMKFMNFHAYFDHVPKTLAWATDCIASPIKQATPSKPSKPTIQAEWTFLSRNIQPVELPRRLSSKPISADFMALKERLKRGTELHKVFETFDFRHIEAALNRLSKNEQSMMKRFLAHQEVQSIATGRCYQEYPFMDFVNGEEQSGVIDLVVDYDDHIDLIDYKLKTIDDEAYQKQLSTYRNYLAKKFNKPIFSYLYSIRDNRFEKVGD